MKTTTTLAPPPQSAYGSLEEEKLAIEEYARTQGYAVCILHTRKVGNKVDGQIKAIVLQCSNAGQPRLTAQKRRTISHETGCKFKVAVRRQDVMWQVEVEVAEHNHEPFVHPSAHPLGRPLNLQQQEYVIS